MLWACAIIELIISHPWGLAQVKAAESSKLTIILHRADEVSTARGSGRVLSGADCRFTFDRPVTNESSQIGNLQLAIAN